MPTKPFEPLLYRELRKVDAKEIIDIASPLLQEEINYATNAFQRCQESAVGAAADEPLPVFASYHHVIGMTDGIEVLISQSCAVPAIPLLRSSFEALLTIEYILKEDCRRRAFAWLVCYFHDRLNRYEMLDASYQKGKDFLTALKTEGLGRYFNFPPELNISHAIQNLKSLLNKPNYQVAENEYQKIKNTRKRGFNWYSLFGGPSNLRDLAGYLNRLASYDMLYRYWSSVVHAGDLSNFLAKTEKDSPALNVLRHPQELKQVTSFTSTLIIDATRLMIGKFRSGETSSFVRWYVSEIRESYLDLSK